MWSYLELKGVIASLKLLGSLAPKAISVRSTFSGANAPFSIQNYSIALEIDGQSHAVRTRLVGVFNIAGAVNLLGRTDRDAV